MLRLGDLAEGNGPLLRWPAGTAGAASDRVVERVVRCPNGVPDDPPRRALAVVAREDLEQLERAAVGEAGALVVVGAGEAPAEVHGLPVLYAAESDLGVGEVAYRLSGAVASEALRVAHGIERVFDLVTRSLARGEGPEGLLRWVEVQSPEGSAARARVVPGEERRQWPAELRERVGDVEALVEGREREMLQWRAQPPRDGGAGRWVVVWPVGAAAPFSLLVIARSGPAWSGQQMQRLHHVATLTDAMVREAEIAARLERADRALVAVQQAGLRALLVGEVGRAAEVLGPSVGGLLEGPVQCAVLVAADSSELAVACEAAAVALEGAEALVVPPERGVEEGEVLRVTVLYRVEGQEPLQEVLEDVTAGVPGLVVGVSAPGPVRGVAELRESAAGMLESAAYQPGRIGVDSGQRSLAEVLAPGARAWARRLLAPVEQLPEAEREQLLVTGRTATGLGITEGARALGIHRHTVTSRAQTLARLTGLDQPTMAHRCAGDLAMRLAALPPPPPGTRPSADAAEVLSEPAAQRWGHELLGVLTPTLLATLAAWARNEMNLRATAAELGVSRNTVSARMRQVSARLQMPLTRERPSALHDVACALHTTGRVVLKGLPGQGASEDDGGPTSERTSMTELRTDRPHSARMYDHFLGGKTNYAADREAAAQVLQASPHSAVATRANRAFMHRATRYAAAELGMRQYLDIGTGIPTEPNLHQIAQRARPEARVVYVDNDPIVLAHAEQFLTTQTREGAVTYLQADVRDPERILNSPQVRETLDLGQPVALSLIAVLHFVEDAAGLVDQFLRALVPGSVLILSHGTVDAAPEERVQQATEAYRASGVPLSLRTQAEVAGLLEGMDLAEPGLVYAHRWRPDEPEEDLLPDSAVSSHAAIAFVR